MKSLSNLYRFGPGPSSSHTIAPYNAARAFRKLIEGKNTDSIVVTFYGSLAFTGVGHGSDRAIVSAFPDIKVEVKCDKETSQPHPLTMRFVACKNGEEIQRAIYYSLGGGELFSNDDESVNEKKVYPFKSFLEIKAFMEKENIKDLKDFCLRFEDPSIDKYLLDCVKFMIRSVEKGLKTEGNIPANSNPRLQLRRGAKGIHEAAMSTHDLGQKRPLLLTSYAYAVAEGSACGDLVVTSPTCGSSGVLPAILYYLHKNKRIPLAKLRDSLYSAGIFGNLIKQNASIAGSVGGCQAEIGTASSMAAVAYCYVEGLSLYQMEYAAECAMEHFLGLSCDPVDGYVIIPCIERNGIGALRAEAAYLYSRFIAPNRKNQVSFDDVVLAMKMTGDSLQKEYKETALGGLASILKTQC